MSEQHELAVDHPEGPATAEQLEKKKKKKKDKVRSAWISFVGRIVAQVMGAVATIFLGLTVIQKYQTTVTPQPASALTSPATGERAVRTPRVPGGLSLAVLPLQSFSPQTQEHLADGMTEAVITDLAGIKGLHVRSRTSVMPYKGQLRSLPEIAGELGVDFILEGSVTTASNRVRIIVQLIHAKSDEHVWAHAYERNLTNVLSVQAEVSRAIARAVEAAIAPTAQARRMSPPLVLLPAGLD